MSRISQDFINTVGCLYEEINIQQEDFLNEDSQYYDAEAAELVEDILSTISTSMVCEGYSAEAIVGFLSDSSEETIIEKYLSFDENILTENTISEEYIVEQLEIFDIAINEGIGSLIGKVAKGAVSLAGRVASKPARAKIAQKLATSKNPEKTRAAAQRLAQREARKGNVGGYTKTSSPIDGGKPMSGKQSAELLSKAKLSQATQKVKDIGSKAKAALPGIAKGAGVFGLGAAGGFVGAKLAGAGSGSKPTASPQPGKTTAAPEAPKPPAAPSGSGGAGGAGTRTPGTPAKPKAPTKDANQKYKDLIKAGKTKEAEKEGLDAWAKANPKLAAKLKSGGTGESEMEKSAEELRKMQNASKQRQGTLMGGPEGPGKIDTKSIEADIKADQERQKKRMEQQNKTPVTAKESYEPYDIVLNYLLSEGHADTLDEANYIMLEMDENAICTIVEEYNDYLLAEEIQEWVNDLVDEGYDLSGYTWDDMVEYYVTEARVDAGKTDKEKREARADRNDTSGLDFFHTISRGKKKIKGRKTSYDSQGNMVRKYKTMQNDKKQVQRERDADEQRSRDRGGMGRGTWDKN